MNDDILTTSEAAKLLGISVRTAQLLIEGGALNSWKTPGGHRRVHRADILAMMAQSNPTPAIISALVILLAAPARRAGHEAALKAVPECRVDGYGDAHTAAFAIGSRLPAVVVVDLDDDAPERMSFLRHLAQNPALGQTALIATGSATPTCLSALGTIPRVLVKSAGELPEAVRAALRDPRTPAEVMEGNPTFPIAANEGQRLVALDRSGLLDTGPEEAFDRLTWLAGRSLRAPVALLSLLSAQRQWFKSRVGLELTETPRSWAFCNHTILQKGVFSVDDLAKPPFDTNPAVAGAPHFRFYAGAPVTDADGFAVGSLCVIDYEPRRLEADDEQTLLALAALASDEVRLRTTDRQLRWALEALNRRATRSG
ncbi:helix-turn-helix domain-containing protein [Dongia sedimenti]|uniref:Excisionase family DNA-binding protein n=1 Tax=Dongia sedimenti TaxID=3064282 RepID=A0ABU0YQH3_9PROT|nr:excisionase family DNA-binding protein [Rhodospirillaceae bacterium R-7]